jgi:UPF0755 protein
MRKYLIIIAIFCILAALVTASYLNFQVRAFLYNPPEVQGVEKVVFVEPGSTFLQVARQLKDENIITDVDKFHMLGKWEEKLASIKAGEFRLRTDMLPNEVLDALTEGKSILYRLSFREGLNWRDTAKIVAESGLTSYEDFKAAIHDKELLQEFHIPFDNAEGFLFPETYMVPRPKDGAAEPIARTILKAFWEQAGEKVWPQVAEGEYPPAEEIKRMVILASLVEKETGKASERERIAGVYANRLRRGMLLQCDPTVIYGLGEAFDGNLKRIHLEDRSNPYNTYRHKGLPPGPICSPGLHALQSAKTPEKHSYLYFVSKGDGSHKFSKNLVDHNRAVRKYQLRR